MNWQNHPARSGSHGRRYSCVANLMEGAIAGHRPEVVVFEAPLARIDRSARFLMSVWGLVEMICFEHAVRCQEAHVGAVRLLVLGTGHSTSTDRANPKLPMLLWCRRHGWNVRDDNAADALILLRFFHLSQTRARATAQAARERLL